MKAERIFSIASIITFFALLPALIIMEIRVLREMLDIAYLFIIADVLLVGFIVTEIFLVVRKWRKEKSEDEAGEEPESGEFIDQEWGEEENTNETNTGSETND
ncbi:MAG: hypothetical protein HZR80_14905 [Candidatus Heimdallarchaeota archaeon]